jgi:hypothetical protein
VSGIAGVTKNAVTFTNAGQFALSGTGLLVVNPNLITQPAVGVTDTYVVTMNNISGGGTTLGTVVVSHGSVKIDSIVMSSGIITPTLIGFSLSASSVALGGTAPTITAPTSASSGAITYTSGTVGTATIDSNTGVITIVGVGTTVITATQAADGNYASATTTITLTVTAPGIDTLVSGGLTWTRNNRTVASPGYANWTTANNTCSALTQGGFTWRLPTQAELSALYTAGGALTTAGWTLTYTWSSTDDGAGGHYLVDLYDGFVGWGHDSYSGYVSCVH